MMLRREMTQLATLLCDVRNGGLPLEEVPQVLRPQTAQEADAVQWQMASARGVVSGFKAARTGDGPGKWGAISARDIMLSPERLYVPERGLRFEVEIGFRLGQDLSGDPGPEGFLRETVIAALDCVFLAVEVLDSRLAMPLAADPLLVRADCLGNHAMLVGPGQADPAAFLGRAPVSAYLAVDDRALVDGPQAHPSGSDAMAPLIWLANCMAREGQGLRGGDRVITGAFGGAHRAYAGQRISAEIAGLGRLETVLCPSAPVLRETA